MPIVISGTNGISGVDGTASNPSYEGTDANTGVFFPAADTVAIGTNGTEALRVNSSQNVGIGTNNPNQPLYVAGTSNVNIVTASSEKTTSGASGTGVGFRGIISNGSGLSQAGAIQMLKENSTVGNSSSYLSFYTNNNVDFLEKMRIDSSGNVGIGTSSPAERLDVVGTYIQAADTRTNNTNKLFGLRMPHYANATTAVNLIGAVSTSGGNALYIGGNDTSFAGTAATAIQFYTAATGSVSSGTQRMLIDSSGYLLLNATSSAGVGITRYQVGSTSSATSQILLQGTSTHLSLYAAAAAEAYVSYAVGSALIFGNGPADGSSFTPRARIDSSGNLLVGTTNAAINAGVGLKILTSATNPTFSAVSSDTTNVTSSYILYSTGAGAYRFYVGMGGTVHATSTTITAISDQRLKENIQDLDVGLDKIMALKPRKFDWKEGKGKNIKGDRGWIAQEFEQVFPEMVGTWMDEPPEGEEPYKSVGADLIPVLVKAIQEQQQMIETLQAKVAALEAR